MVGHYPGNPITIYPGVTELSGSRGDYVFDWSDATGRDGDNRYTPVVTFASQELAEIRLADLYEAYFRGRLVRRLADGPRGAGRHGVEWDGCGDDGVRLAAGLYLVRLEAGGRVLSRRVTLLK